MNSGAGLHVLGYFTTSGEWQLAQFDVGDATIMLDELVFQEHHGSGANTIVIDNLVGGGTGDAAPAEPTPEPEQPVEPTAEPTVEPTAEPTAEPAPVEPQPQPEQPTLEPAPEQPIPEEPAPQPEPTAEQPLEPTAEPTVEPEPTAEPEPQPQPEQPAPAGHAIFTDGLSPEWQDQSWSGSSANVSGGPDGSTAYKFTCKDGWCAVRFVHSAGVATGEGGSLSFTHRREGKVNATYKVWVVDGRGTMHVLGYVTPGAEWADARFDLGPIAKVTTVVLQEHHGTSGGVILLDNMRLN